MKTNKKIIALLVAVMMMLLCACGNNAATNNGGANDAATNNTTANQTTGDNAGDAAANTGDTGSTAPAEPAEFTGKLQGPFLMTTCGQSTGSVMCHMAAVQAGLTSTDEHQLLANEVATVGAGAKTLIVTTGTSGKGMGAAGTDVDDEIERCTAVIEAAREQGMLIAVAHIEGMSRRTDANDQASIDAMLPLADVIVCVEDSDSDGLFSTYAEENDIPIIIVPDALSLSEYME